MAIGQIHNDAAADFTVSATGVDLLSKLGDGLGDIVLGIAAENVREKSNRRDLTEEDLREAIKVLVTGVSGIEESTQISPDAKAAVKKVLVYLEAV